MQTLFEEPLENLYAREIMNSSNHTPAPWHVGMRPGPIIYGVLGEQIADLRGPSLGNEETSANARLIASAPELLASLIELESMVAEMLPKHGPCGWGELALEQARGSIAKATGNNS